MWLRAPLRHWLPRARCSFLGKLPRAAAARAGGEEVPGEAAELASERGGQCAARWTLTCSRCWCSPPAPRCPRLPA